MAVVVYLHIGMNKTGTSAIQTTLARHSEAMRSAGLLYPQAGRMGMAHYGLSDTLGFSQGTSEPRSAQKHGQQALYESVQHELQASEAGTVVFSSENFSLPRKVEAVRDFFSSFDVRVVVYLRRHDSWWESAYAQAVKMVERPPWGPGIEAFLRYHKRWKPNHGNYRELVDRWAGVFGPRNIIVRPYEAQQNDGGVVGDFFGVIGHGEIAQGLEPNSTRVNEKLDDSILTLIDIYQRLDVGDRVRARLLEHAKSAAGSGTRSTLLSPALRRKLIETHADDYAYIARTYLGRDDGRLFLDPWPEPDEDWKPPKRLTTVEIVEQTVKALGATWDPPPSRATRMLHGLNKRLGRRR